MLAQLSSLQQYASLCTIRGTNKRWEKRRSLDSNAYGAFHLQSLTSCSLTLGFALPVSCNGVRRPSYRYIVFASGS
jgi:hypothetical protein